MPRHRLPEGERKERVALRLPQWLIEEIKKDDNIQQLAEKLLTAYVRNKKNEKK